ncbi:MAG: 4-hydroxy-tetrahydrodipicolinate reductase [Chitinophagaceae bacterium]|nr:MAG: 4-hydroxy-tetrahydrodipicolinate reductase [Chitinophagaceae bacterium]
MPQKKLSIALIGYGKMGRSIESIAVQKGHRIGLAISSGNLKEFTKEQLQKCNVAIEFTNPHAAVKNIERCLDAGIPVVCGSTGWLNELSIVEQKQQQTNGALLYASNFSIGVNIFFEINKKLAALMSGYAEYNVAIEEIHHTAKKDAPSGTAITLAEQILATHPQKKHWVNDSSLSPDELIISSKRIDPAPGTHHVKYSSPIDDIEIIHTAHNREGFAAGAVLAAEFIVGRQGIFSMKDVLGI